jgi:hypothetical protein
MTQLLIKALEAAMAGPAEKKALSEKIVARDLAAFEKSTGTRYMIEGSDGKMGKARELLLSEAVESTTLIQTEINRTIMEGSEPAKCFRNAVPVFAMNGNTMQINIGETGTYAPIVAEGSEIPINNQAYTARTWTAKKFGERPMITREMVNDALFSVIELEVRKTGYRIENTLNQWMLSVLIENAGNDHDIAAGTGNDKGINAMISARQQNLIDGYVSDTIVIHPGATSLIYAGYVPSYNPSAQNYINTGQLPTIVGMKLLECGVAYSQTSAPFKASAAGYEWSPATADDLGAIVFDSNSCGGIGMREDTRVEQFTDPIRDLVGMSVTMRAACQYGVANSICRVTY